DGRYDFSRLLPELALQIGLQVDGPDSYAGNFHLEGMTDADSDAEQRHYRLGMELRRSIAGGPWQSWVEGGRLDLILDRPAPGHDQLRAEFAADRLRAGRISLQELQARLAVDRLQYQEGVTQIAIPTLELNANPHGNRDGLLRGPLQVRLRPSASGS